MSLITLIAVSSIFLVLVLGQERFRRPPPRYSVYFRPHPPGSQGYPDRPRRPYRRPRPPPQGFPSHGDHYCSFPGEDTDPGSDVTTEKPFSPASRPPVALPSGTILLPNGSARFPNGTVLLIRFAGGTDRPAVRLPSGTIKFSNGTTIPPGTPANFPPPGIPLNATNELLIDPPLILPDSTMVFLNGSLWIPGFTIISTELVNQEASIMNCGGVVCHHFVDTWL